MLKFRTVMMTRPEPVSCKPLVLGEVIERWAKIGVEVQAPHYQVQALCGDKHTKKIVNISSESLFATPVYSLIVNVMFLHRLTSRQVRSQFQVPHLDVLQ